jgi:outer membrane protein assembly factor BamA
MLSDMVRVVAIAVASLLVACPVAADQAPPDPSRGESYDGRPRRPKWQDDLKLVPRLVLLPPRLFFAGLGSVAQRALDWDERGRVHETIADALSSDDGQIGVRPAFTYSISFAPTVGLRVFDRKLLGPSTNFEVTAMTGGVDIVYAEAFARPTPSDRALEVGLDAIYNRRNDQMFSGIGYTTDDPRTLARRSRYSVDALDAVGRLTLARTPGLFLDLGSGFGLRRFGNGRYIGDDRPIFEVYCLRAIWGGCEPGTVDEVRVPGFRGGTQFFRASATLRADSRDNWYRPSSGALVEIGGDWTHGLGGDDSHYLRAHVAATGVLDLWNRSRTLSIRFEANALQPIGTAIVPFSELIVIGGPDTFRGFRPGRFRNFSSLFAGLEYRWPVWMWMDATLFAEYGGVFGRGFEGFSFDRMKPDVGVGVRIRSSDTFFARAQIAYGWGDGWQAFFSVNTGF